MTTFMSRVVLKMSDMIRLHVLLKAIGVITGGVC